VFRQFPQNKKKQRKGTRAVKEEVNCIRCRGIKDSVEGKLTRVGPRESLTTPKAQKQQEKKRWREKIALERSSGQDRQTKERAGKGNAPRQKKQIGGLLQSHQVH